MINTVPGNMYRRSFYAEPQPDGAMSVTEVSLGLGGNEYVEDIFAYGADSDAASRVVFTVYNMETSSLSGYSVNGETTEIYPNKNALGAGEPVFLGYDRNAHLYKIDAEGRIEDITK